MPTQPVDIPPSKIPKPSTYLLFLSSAFNHFMRLPSTHPSSSSPYGPFSWSHVPPPPSAIHSSLTSPADTDGPGSQFCGSMYCGSPQLVRTLSATGQVIETWGVPPRPGTETLLMPPPKSKPKSKSKSSDKKSSDKKTSDKKKTKDK
ncbi:hypothetical protein E4U21_002403 [Claviceps maximensis]|nr:hypothetical protein E4U21_002403 [Claviceps maximensis]